MVKTAKVDTQSNPSVARTGERLVVFSIKASAGGGSVWVRAGSAWVNRDVMWGASLCGPLSGGEGSAGLKKRDNWLNSRRITDGPTIREVDNAEPCKCLNPLWF